MALAADDCPGGADCDHDSDPRIVWTVRRTCTTEPCQHHGDGAAPTGCWEHPTLTATAALERWNTTVKIWDLLDTDGFNEAKDPTAAFDDEARYQEVENRMLSTHELRRDDVEILYA